MTVGDTIIMYGLVSFDVWISLHNFVMVTAMK